MKYNIKYEDIVVFADAEPNGTKFKDLCEALNIKYPKNSYHSKQAILNQLKQYCNIEEKKEDGKHPYYIIKEVYPEPILASIHVNNKFQCYVEQAIILEALKNPEKPLYVSNTGLLRMINLVNDNFKIICNPKYIKQLKDRDFLYKAAPKIYETLYKWARERINQMEARHVIELQRGYRLYNTFINDKGQEITIYQDVDKGSELENICNKIMYTAINETKGIPKDWARGWLHPKIYEELQKNIKRISIDTFYKYHMPWKNIKEVIVIIPINCEEILKNRLENVEEILNKEAQRKIHNTNTLNYLTGEQREIAINEIIDLYTDVRYKELLQNKKREE